MRKAIFSALVMLAFVSSASAYTLSGSISDASGNALAGANITIEDTDLGGATDDEGNFSIVDVASGDYIVTASLVGYASQSFFVMVSEDASISFRLQVSSIDMDPLEVIASRSDERSPTSFTEMKKSMITAQLGSRDIPLVLDTTPSVFATEQGGGAGDARVNVRGFNQRNVAIMINGVPVNDMENGWVYWSNWDGVGDAASSIQVQRGMGDVNLAVPAIGGTMNIVTDPAQLERKGSIKQELGSWGFSKTTLSYNTGLINDRFALSGSVVKKTGDGYYKGTWTDASAYYVGASYQINPKHRLELYAVGAPQRHGQNLYAQNAAVYDPDYARDELGYRSEWISVFTEKNTNNEGRDYNQNYVPISSAYKGNDSKQYFYMYGERKENRFDSSFINERENFFHKPQINLNYYLTLNANTRLSNVLYFSGGSGGGTGTYGSMKWDYSGFSRVVDFGATWENNAASEEGSKGILRNSINRQSTIGLVSKLDHNLSEALTLQVGIDWRTAEIEHAREVRDLLGGSYFYFDGNDNDSEADYRKQIGDIIAYWNTNTVDWLGSFARVRYEADRLSGFAMAGYSIVGYTFEDHFKRPGTTGQKSENTGIGGGQFKTGARYALSDDLSLFANLGIVNKVPIFDAAINDRDGSVYEDPELEKFRSFELGGEMHFGRQLTVKSNLYYTQWKDRTNTRGVINEDGSEGYIFLTGLNSVHSGFETEVAYQPSKLVRADMALSVGNWKYTDDVSGRYTNFAADGTRQQDEYNYYIKDLKVGDAPQTQLALGVSVFPVEGLRSQLVYKFYASHYSDWDPFSRTDAGDRAQSWQLPNAGVMDLHLGYNLPVRLAGAKLRLDGHVFNLLDSTYIMEATDNSQFNALKIDGELVDPHGPASAEVFYGLPRRMNVSLSVVF